MKKKILILVVLLTGLAFSTNSAVAASSKVLLGVYPNLDLQSGIDELVDMDAWLSRNDASNITIAGDFISITYNNNPYPAWNNVIPELNAAWNNGYIPFVNLMPSRPWEGTYYTTSCDDANDIANGNCDSYLRLWADLYKEWAGTTKMAYIAPLPEANGDWALYSTTGSTFIQAYRRIQTIFENRGVPSNTVKWVFAPNGWHDSKFDWRKFENYYPGDNYVDVVAFSSYNYGGCPKDTEYRKWTEYTVGFEPYLVRMTAMAPTKPIFISQTGTVNLPEDSSDPTQNKSDWVREVFNDLANYPNLKAILYFNKLKAEGLPNCPVTDYRLFYHGQQSGEPGLIDMMSDPRFSMDYIFADVQPVDPDSGMQNIWYYDAVHTIYNNGITNGCSQNPLMYCPDNPVTRAEMSAFLLNSMEITPPQANSSHPFSDISGHWAEGYIEELYDLRITGGYPDGTYRPDNTVTRAEMAVFLLNSLDISVSPVGYVPDHNFIDITGHWAEPWINELANLGITGGYPDDTYRPGNLVSRAEMAVFLVKAFDLQ